MKLTNTKPVSLFTLILLFHTVQAEASHDDIDEVRILVVGVRGQSRFSAADLLSGRKDGGQEDREIVKTPVITDGARRMMLVTGPNLCEEDAARQTFTTALFLSSPGPHAVLMLLNLEDQQSQQCDIEKRAQELLGAEVLQYCIVLLLQNHQEPLTGASRGIAEEMINACGGRFHIIRDSEPKPAQRATLIAEIDKLVQLNGGSFYSVHKLETEETIQDMHENQVLSVIYETFGGAVGIIGWIFFISVTALAIYTKGKDINLIYGAAFTVFVLFMVYLRRFLSPDLAIPLNLALLSSLATVLTKDSKLADIEFKSNYLLSGRKDRGQEDREIVKTPVITDGARRMMLVTGPNLCEEDAARQTFTTALFLSSPGPHAVLMLLNLEDQQSQQCDIEKRAQELLGAEVLQYCIVLLLQNHQEPLTGASRGIAGEMINACGGRIHIIRDSETKPAQRATLIAEIDNCGSPYKLSTSVQVK
ncbi:uncharacterized protein LOC128014026 [Carassius gibelio]|uniref:uncharacterized protein LOC128014026 n=1 Tax=Carassius gibelio TaxID=101364 RepID=UPI002277C9D5|nr:uncharacterized protein LOC128014026 [Carassius gibelio]